MSAISRVLGSTFLLLVFSVTVCAQTAPPPPAGWNAAIQGSSAQSQSYAFVDGTAYANACSGSCDICQIISLALSKYAGDSNGVVIDTRGVGGSALTCSSTDGNPWGTALQNVVLLPAGTITIYASWVLSRNTHLVGEGPNATIISAAFTSGDMIDMGSTSCATRGGGYNCPDTVIEHLQLNGNGSSNLNGIVNGYGQELNRVNDVSITGLGTGLTVNGYGENSGPYTNLSMYNVGQCVNISPGGSGSSIVVVNTRGIHGLYCSTTAGSSTTPAIQISTANNTLQDIQITGGSSQDGILLENQTVGSNTSLAAGTVLMNVRGSGLKNVVHLYNSPSAVGDITILGVSRSGGTNLIQDDVTGTSLTDTNVGMYILGEPVAAGSNASAGYSRFTTSTIAATPTWLVGASDPTSSSCGVGKLYSCTGSGCTYTLWECEGGGTWLHVK